MYFNPRTPQGVRPGRQGPPGQGLAISIHAPRKGCDGGDVRCWKSLNIFQSTHPARGATRASPSPRSAASFQSTHPARGATARSCCTSKLFCISIHAPRKGCDAFREALAAGLVRFQSTHPARGATRSGARGRCPGAYFNPRTPQGVRPAWAAPQETARISIHAPRKGCDAAVFGFQLVKAGFQSTHPARGATRRNSGPSSRRFYFNPRTPQGVRPISLKTV